METVRGVIVGGASCTGKSSIVAGFKKFGLDVRTLEIERFYTDPRIAAASLPNDLEWLHANIAVAAVHAEIEAVPPPSQVCRIAFLRLAMAGGPTIRSWERRAFVVRGSLSSPTVFPINSRLVMTGRARNFELGSGDIVFFPRSPIGKGADIGEMVRDQFGTLNILDLMIRRATQ